MADYLIHTQGDTEYRKTSLCPHSAWKSHENGVTAGEVRVIDGELYFADSVDRRRFSKDTVWWYPVRKRNVSALIAELDKGE